MAEFDDLLARLAEIVTELTRIPIDEFAARAPLVYERDRIRDRLAEIRGESDPDADRPTGDLERELKALEARAREVGKQRIDLVKQAGGGSQTGEMHLGAADINRRIEAASGLAEIEKRAARIRGVLEDRGEDKD